MLCRASVDSGMQNSDVPPHCLLVVQARSSRGPLAGPRMLFSGYRGPDHSDQGDVGSGLGKFLLYRKVGGVDRQGGHPEIDGRSLLCELLGCLVNT